MTDQLGRSELHFAAMDGTAQLVRSLIESGDDANVRDANLSTPLHLAAREGNLAAAAELLASGAHVDAQNDDGNTPLWNAVFTATDDGRAIARLLLQHGADPRHRNVFQRTPQSIVDSLFSGELKAIFAPY
ncbi:ankyrin repeat domain-containing protein [Williamsia sp. CHRR-6]|uniref:ankyrin repeat domain-containing protein n=1 Tax=Williamsia sp. CHRR-6 TaxID=2835871 RepID=UPI001BDAB3EE|nr:ankyrin repeat domain-containing protein [Williamsia sp. CHRR-6]MBT0567265.1 ankyrin repeat domain-containing protein [Williamsia sp. CHRR-6]